MSRILITGGKGVLGSALVPQLLATGYQVCATSRRPPAPEETTIEWQRAIEWRTLDLATAEGIAEAVAGVDTIVHAASDPRRAKQIDVDGTALLLRQAEAAGVSHFIYVSIVGIDRISFAYYRHKLAAERLVKEAKVPWSILRATQFHSLLDMVFQAVNRLPFILLPTDFRFQPLAPDEAAQRLVEVVQAGPGERLPDISGPEILTAAEMIQSWLAVRGQRRKVFHLPIPGQVSASFRQGLNTTPEGQYGQIHWENWIAQKYSQDACTASA